MAVSETFLAALRGETQSRTLSVVVEFYHQDAVPGADGFDPAGDMFLWGVASTNNNVSFRGRDYNRLISKGGISSIRKNIDKEVTGFSLSLSNVTREVIDFENAYGFEGLVCIVRCLDRATSVNLNDSIILFTGRCDAPDNFSKSSEKAKINVQQILKATEVNIPRRSFSTADPKGRAQSDLEFEGFIASLRGGNVSYDTRERRGGVLGLFGMKKTVHRTLAWSSHLGIKEDMMVPFIFGRTQTDMITFVYEDRGTYIAYTGFWADGHEHGIKAVLNVRSTNPNLPLLSQVTKLGKKGGTVDSDTTQWNDNPSWAGAGTFSRTAYSNCAAGGTTLADDDAAPETVGIPLGLLVPIPNSDGEFEIIDFSDSAVALSRQILMSEHYFNLPAEWHDDEENLEAYDYGNHILIDNQNTDTVLLPSSQNGIAGNQYHIYKSTGSVSHHYFENLMGSGSIENAFGREAEYNFYGDLPYNSDDFDGSGVPVLPPTTYRRRWTCNIQLRDKMKALDFLHDIVYPTSNLYRVQKPNGKIAHRNKKPQPFTFVAVANSVGATELRVRNVNHWMATPGLVLIGANLENSEVRRVESARYDATVAAAVTASGGLSASAGTLGGGSSSVAPHATLTVTDPAGTKTYTIGAWSLVYVPAAGETAETVAAMITGQINSHEELNKDIKATWELGATIVLIESRAGFLEFDSALNNIHLAAIAGPASAISLTALSGGTLPAGKYQYSRSYITAEGETLVSPVTEITIAADQKISVPGLTLPVRVLAVRHYFSVETNGVRRKLHTQNAGESFVIDSLSKNTARVEPYMNLTGEEIHRIHGTFTDKGNPATNLASSNMLKGTFSAKPNGKGKNYNQVKIKYFDSAADYQITTLIINDEAKQAKAKQPITLEIDGAGIDNEHQARRVANQKLAELSDGNKFVGFTADNEALLLEEGHVLCVTDESMRYVNEAVSIEDIDIDPADGYPTINFSARKYRRSFYDDQQHERLVPLPVIQNTAINLVQAAPTIFIADDAENLSVPIGVRDLPVEAAFIKVESAFDVDFTDGRKEYITNSSGSVYGLPSIISVLRELDATFDNDLDIAADKFIRASFSSNGFTYGETSNILPVTYATVGGGGGSSGDTPPEPGTGTAPTLGTLAFASGEVTGPITNGGGTGTIRVWRKLETGGTYGEIASGAFADMVASGLADSSLSVNGTYYYKLTQDGVPGESGEKSVAVTGFGSTATPPTWGMITFNHILQRFTFNWTPNGGSSGYEIQGEVNEDGTFSAISINTLAASSATTKNYVYDPGTMSGDVWKFRIQRTDVTGWSSTYTFTVP